MEFMRFSAPDQAALAQAIEETRAKLKLAQTTGEPMATVEHAADLGSMLTTARQEAEARELLLQFLALAESMPGHEPSGWFMNAYATALQYCNRRSEAETYFANALALCQTAGWSRLQSFVLHHWARSQAEQARFDEAQASFTEALRIRMSLNDRLQDSTRRALAELARVRERASQGPMV